jgi:hypothetical protein
MSASNYLETELLDHVLGKGVRDFSSPNNLYVALHTSDPGETGATGELAGNGYARQSATFAAASGNSAVASADLTFTASGANWGTITHASIWDALSGGNCLYYGALTTSRVVNDGDSLTFVAANNALTVTAD